MTHKLINPLTFGRHMYRHMHRHSRDRHTASVISLVQFLMQVCSRNDTAHNSNAGASFNSHWADTVCNDLCAASPPEKAATALVWH